MERVRLNLADKGQGSLGGTFDLSSGNLVLLAATWFCQPPLGAGWLSFGVFGSDWPSLALPRLTLCQRLAKADFLPVSLDYS